MPGEERESLPPAPIAPGTTLKGRYRIERTLGRGGMAAVWRATDTVLGRPVAIKALSDTIAADPEYRARFRREAHLAAGLRHPNLVEVYDYSEAAERPYLAMELVPGPNLAEGLSAGTPVDVERLARELLDAVAHIHGAGILHRDIKPQNVMLGQHGEAKLIDFGIALPPDATALTRTGLLIGTARYLAPELTRGEAATERSDLYSCGVVLREALDAGASDQLRRTVEWLAADEPAARPPSAIAALARLERTSARQASAGAFEPGGEPTQALAPVGHRAGPGAGSRTRARAAALAAILAIGAAVLVVVLSGRGGEDEPRGGAPGAAATGEGGAAPDERRSATAGAEERPDGGAEASSEGGQGEGGEPEADSKDDPTAAGEDAARGASLNEEGYALIQSGSPEEAVPILEEAVRSFPPGTEDLNYAYALFNLGNALRLSGRPGEAIPILEQRLAIPNQTGEVRRELEAAQREASS